MHHGSNLFLIGPKMFNKMELIPFYLGIISHLRYLRPISISIDHLRDQSFQ